MFFQLALHVLHRPNLVTKLKPISEEHKQKQELPLRRNPFPLTSNSNSHSQSLQISPHFSLSLPTTTTATNASSTTMSVTTTVSSSSSSVNKLLKVHHRSSASSFRSSTTTTTTEVSSEDVVVVTAADRVRSEGFRFGFESEVKREVNWCFGCRRKVELTGFRCRCGELFCAKHRYTDRHMCSYDYKVAGPNESVLPWERDWEEDKVVEEEERAWTPKRRAKAPSLAELTMEDEELRRLRRVGMYIRERISSSDMGLSLVAGFGT